MNVCFYICIYSTFFQPSHEKKDQWIQNWAKEMKTKTNPNAQKQQNAENDTFKSLFGPKDQYPIPMASIINPSALSQLQQLYGKRSDKSSDIADQAIGTLSSNSMEAHVRAAAKLKREQQIKSDLMDVSLDD